MADPTLVVSLSPHDKSRRSTASIMWLVIAALLPALVMAVIVFGPWVLVLVLVSVASALAAETFAWYLLNRKALASDVASERPSLSITDGSAVLTGLLLAYNVPSSLPLWQVAVGSAFAIIVAKMVFGGLGQNPFNPALAGRAFLLASFPVTMTSFPKAQVWHGLDATSAATALGAAKEGLRAGQDLGSLAAGGALPGHLELFLGFNGGCLGEISAVALLAGGVFLLITRVITWEGPVGYLGGLGLITGIAWLANPAGNLDPLYHLLAGGAFLAAFFMVTDMVTSPMTRMGRLVWSCSAGLLAGLIRLVGSYPEGASYAILVMNALVPVFDRIFKPARFGQAQSLRKEAA